jgi:hypothetical protein
MGSAIHDLILLFQSLLHQGRLEVDSLMILLRHIDGIQDLCNYNGNTIHRIYQEGGPLSKGDHIN